MIHFTDEQFEEVMQGKEVRRMHLKQCIECRERLAEKQTLARRLRSAFAAIKAKEGIAQRIRRQLNVSSIPPEHIGTRRLLNIRSHWQSWSALAAAAAAVLIVAVPLVIYLAMPSAAVAAQAELVRIHEHNLSASHEFYSEADAEKLSDYFKSKLGFSPSMPRPGQGLALRGCCVRHFRGQIVGSYVVETLEGIISVIVVTDRPESLGMERKFRLGEYIFWASSFAKCKLVAVRIGQYSYCAVGEVPDAYLTELLIQLIPGSKS